MKRLAFLAIALAGCRSTPPAEPQPYEAASSLPERLGALTQGAPRSSPLGILPQKSVGTRTSSARKSASPNDGATLLAEGISFLEQGNLPEAHRRATELWARLDAERALTLDEDLKTAPYRDVALLLGVTECSQGDRTKGILILERLIRNNPTWEAPYLALTESYSSFDAHRLAARVAGTGLDRVGRASPALYASLARELRRQGESDEAVRVVERGLKEHPSDSVLLLWRGVIEDEQGRHAAACEHFRLAFERTPENAAMAHNHALCLTRGGDWDKALSVLRLSVARNPRDPNLRLLAGNVQFRQGKQDEAMKSWKDFLSLADPDDPRRTSVLASLEQSGSQDRPERPIVP